MLFPLHIPCRGCGATDPVDIRLDEESPQWKCPKCGELNGAIFDLDFTIGYRLLARSHYEHTARKDFSLAIVLSAMAFDCELARLFHKWKGIETLRKGSNPDPKAIEKEYRDIRSVRAKIKSVGRLLYSEGIDAFACSTPNVKTMIEGNFKSVRIGSLASDFQKTVFEPRNRILHLGETKFEEADSARVFSIAKLGILVLQEMDKRKRETLK